LRIPANFSGTAYKQGVISDITAVIQELKNVDFRLLPDVDDIIASL
jgi:hypothetical protein